MYRAINLERASITKLNWPWSGIITFNAEKCDAAALSSIIEILCVRSQYLIIDFKTGEH
jgi:hypothetical protein